jgi:hypothetical protein
MAILSNIWRENDVVHFPSTTGAH